MASRRRQVAATLLGAAVAGALEARLGLRGRAAVREAMARRMREAFERLGPAFVKLGQLISVRPDLFSPEWVFEMEALRDRVPPLPASDIKAIIAEDLGLSVERLFASFDDVALASASIAQVHRAVLAEAYRPVIGDELPAGTQIAVKVVRPHAERTIVADIEAARGSVRWIGRLPGMPRIDLPALLEEFASTLRSECDLRNEARVADRFAFDFRRDALIVVPRAVWPLTSRRVLTMEYVEGWPLSELDAAHRSGIDARALAVHGARAFLRQVLVVGRYHADLHPANMLVTPDGRIAYLDFGIVGTTSSAQREAIAQVLVATVYGDADRAIRYSAELGLVVTPEKREAVRGRVAQLMARTLGGGRRDVRAFATGFLGIMAEEGIEVPVGYGLLVKALVTVEGVARALYPDIDIVEVARPFVTQLVAGRALQSARLAQRLPRAFDAAVAELLR